MPSRDSSSPRRRWRAAVLAVALGSIVSIGVIRGRAGLGQGAAERGPSRSVVDWLPAYDAALPDDVALKENLDRAIDLREREHFDRVLDAREPGELIEHATLTENVFARRAISIARLFVVGDELFAYPFRPENGWGHGTGVDRRAPDYTPRPQRVHSGAAGGPDAFGCFSCHSKGGQDGAGTQTQNGFLFGDGEQITGADQRNPPHLLGMGPIEVLGREMSAALQAEAAAVLARARAEGQQVEAPLTAKGVSFGRIVGRADGTLDRSQVQGVDRDLTVRPFGWKGHQATLRDMIEESLHIHQGLLSKRIHLAVRDGTLPAAPYGKGPWDDLDEDGVSLEIDSGMLTTVVGYLAQLEAPVMRPPHDPGLLDAFAAGRARFESVGCGECHVPTLELDDPKLDVREPAAADATPFIVDVAKDGDGPKIEPKYGGRTTTYLVHLFSDLKRHDMGPDLASPAPQGTIPASVFLTRPLWDLADTAPYLHDGRAPTIQDAIVMHGGEATAARDAYFALDETGRASIRVYLASLSRAPKLIVP